MPTDGSSFKMAGGRELVLTLTVDRSYRGRLGGDGDICCPPPENSAQFIATRPIMDMCLALEQHPGAWVSQRWREQGKMELEGIRAASRALEM